MVPAAFCDVCPNFAYPVIPWLVNGLLLVINNIPLKAFAPYKAEDAPGSNSTLCTSISDKPIKFPKTKFNKGDELSIPSTNCIKRVLATEANPRVLIDLNDILEVFICTSFMFSSPS